jgi:NADPH-dependent curcumin reductase CurA
MSAWRQAGKVGVPFDEVSGLENTLDAYRKLFTGGNIGKSIVKVKDLSP